MSSHLNNFLIKLCTYVSIGVAGTLVLGKTYAWYLTGSLSIQASLFDSLLDVFASFINFIAVSHALRPADAEHRFGHGKAEALASLGQSLIIAFSSIWLLKETSERFLHPEAVVFNKVAVMVMIVSITLTLFLVLFQRYVIRRTQSLAITADSLHYQTDLFGNIAVLVSFSLTAYYNIHYFDTIAGGFITVYILYTSWHIAKKAFDVLMDRELEPIVIDKIIKIAQTHPEVLGLHDLRTRSSGQSEFIQMHLDLDGSLTLQQAHAIAEEIEQEIMASFPRAEVIIHQDPVPALNSTSQK